MRSGLSAVMNGGPCGLPVEVQQGGLVTVRSIGPHVLGADLGAVPDDVDERHRVAAAEPVLVLQPGDDLGALRAGSVVAPGDGLVDKRARGFLRLLLDRVEIGLGRASTSEPTR